MKNSKLKFSLVSLCLAGATIGGALIAENKNTIIKAAAKDYTITFNSTTNKMTDSTSGEHALSVTTNGGGTIDFKYKNIYTSGSNWFGAGVTTGWGIFETAATSTFQSITSITITNAVQDTTGTLFTIYNTAGFSGSQETIATNTGNQVITFTGSWTSFLIGFDGTIGSITIAYSCTNPS